MDGSAVRGRPRAAKNTGGIRAGAGAALTVWLKYLAVAMAFILLAFGANAGYEAAVRESYFNVTQVRIEGLSAVPESAVRKLIGSVEGKNSLTLDMREIGERLLTHPWMESVDMRRELPATLVAAVRERVPAFIAVFRAGAWLMDGKGKLIEKVGDPGQVSMPLLTGARIENGARPGPGASVDGTVAELAVMALDKLGGYKLLGQHSLRGLDFAEPGIVKAVFMETEACVRFPARKWTDEMERLVTVDHILRGRGGPAPSLSLLFTNKVIASWPVMERAVIGGGERNG